MSTTTTHFDVLVMAEEGGYSTLGLYVRGHHDPAEVLAYCVDEGYADVGEAAVENVRQTRFRRVPTETAGWFRLVEGSGRGAFPVTFVDIEEARLRRARIRRAAATVAAL